MKAARLFLEILSVCLGAVLLGSCTVAGFSGTFVNGVKLVDIAKAFGGLLLAILVTATFISFVFVITRTNREVHRIGERLDALEDPSRGTKDEAPVRR